MMPSENPSNLIDNDKWIEGCKKRLAILRPEMKDAKEAFLEEAAHILDIDQEELIAKAKKRFQDAYIKVDEESIKPEESRIAAYGKSPEYLKKAEETTDAILAGKASTFDPLDKDFVAITNIFLTTKQERASQAARAENARTAMSEYDIMRTIRMMFENSYFIEELYKAWERPWGDINVLRSKAHKRGIREELLETVQKVGKIENSISDLPYTNLVDVAVYKTDEEKKTGIRLTDKEFCRRYTYKHGKKINRGSLKAARNGTALYGKRNARDILSNRKGEVG